MKSLASLVALTVFLIRQNVPSLQKSIFHYSRFIIGSNQGSADTKWIKPDGLEKIKDKNEESEKNQFENQTVANVDLSWPVLLSLYNVDILTFWI